MSKCPAYLLIPCCTRPVHSLYSVFANARWALKLQCYLFEIRHRKGSDNANADAISRSPLAAPAETPVVTVLETQPMRFDKVTIVYSHEGGQDSDPSFPEELERLVCNKPTQAEVMILCDQCQEGYHIFCLDARLKSVPEGDWYCPKHIKQTVTASGGATSPLVAPEPAPLTGRLTGISASTLHCWMRQRTSLTTKTHYSTLICKSFQRMPASLKGPG